MTAGSPTSEQSKEGSMGATVCSYHLVSKAIEMFPGPHYLLMPILSQDEHVIIRGREHLTESEVSCYT